MSMHPHSEIVASLDTGLVLAVTIEELAFTAYVAVSEPDINLVADLVPPEQFEQEGDLHVTAVNQPDEARQQIEDMAFNMNPGDAVVFLCADPDTYRHVLAELGQDDIGSGRLN